MGLSNTEDLLLCDVDPAPRGRVGQLIRASGLGDFRATDARINAYVARFAELLEKGSVRWDAMLPRSPAAASLQQSLPLATEGVLRTHVGESLRIDAHRGGRRRCLRQRERLAEVSRCMWRICDTLII